MTGVELIAAERQRQINSEGWSSDHDDEHAGGELAMAAVVYAMPPKERASEILKQNFAEILWPWGWCWFKPAKGKSANGRIRELVKAGALCAAEIDRLQRLEASQKAERAASHATRNVPLFPHPVAKPCPNCGSPINPDPADGACQVCG